MFQWIVCILKRIFPSRFKVLPAKDPNDFTLTESSTNWKSAELCPVCCKYSSHEERMADLCNGCGNFIRWSRTMFVNWRKIYDGHKWVYQFKYWPNIMLISETFKHIPPQSITDKGIS